MTSDTSARDTPAARATSSIVGGREFRDPRGLMPRAAGGGFESVLATRLTAMDGGSILPLVGAR
jgi:hypothetical protein